MRLNQIILTTFHFKKTVPDFACLKGVRLDIQQQLSSSQGKGRK